LACHLHWTGKKFRIELIEALVLAPFQRWSNLNAVLDMHRVSGIGRVHQRPGTTIRTTFGE
jgi:hypothetical protein